MKRERTFLEIRENMKRGVKLEVTSDDLNSFSNRCIRFSLDHPNLSDEMKNKLLEHRMALDKVDIGLSTLSIEELEAISEHWGKLTDEILAEAKASLQ